MDKSPLGKGILFACSAYIIWGSLPIYWKAISALNSINILGFRIIFSLFLVGGILLAKKNTSWLRFYKDKKKRLPLILAGLLITFNWGIYIWAVNSGRTIETSLGYYINPLFSIVLGLIFFREKLKPLQIAAFGLAIAGVLVLTVLTGRLPWVSLGLAVSFALYGLLKKTISLSALESLGIETLVAFPLGLLMVFTSFGAKISFPDAQIFFLLGELPLHTLFLFLLCGVATTFPLLLFGKGAKILPLSTLGFVQFLSPTLSFITGYFIFHESFPIQNFIAFGFIWTAAILYIISLKPANKQERIKKTNG